MTEEQFKEFTEEVIPQQLFHVEPKDRPTCLKHKPLQWLLDTYLISEEKWDKMMEKNEKIKKELSQREEQKLFHDILENEREEQDKTYNEKIQSWDDGGCSTGMNED